MIFTIYMSYDIISAIQKWHFESIQFLHRACIIFVISMALIWLKIPLEIPLAYVPVLLTIGNLLQNEVDLIPMLYLSLSIGPPDLVSLRPNCCHSIEVAFFLSINYALMIKNIYSPYDSNWNDRKSNAMVQCA